MPIIPVSYDLSRRMVSRSWDQFVVPLPFARCVTRFGPPLTVPREPGDVEREALRRELEARLAAITDQPLEPRDPSPAKA